MLVIYLGPYIDPRLSWWFTFFGMFYPYVLVANIVCIVLWLLMKKRYFWISLAVILLGIAHVDRYYGFSMKGDVAADDLRILTFNTKGFSEVGFSDKLFDQLERYLKENDVILLQEITARQLNRLKTDFPDYATYHHEDVHLAILTKYRVLDGGLTNRQNASNGSIWSDLQIQDMSMRVYNVHLQSYQVGQKATDIIDKGNIGEGQTWADVKSVLSQIKSKSKVRADQIDQITEHMESTDLPIIVAGDFNDTPVSFTYRQMARDLTDTFCARGRGVGTTYAGKIPLLRIDYIFADADFDVIDHQIIDSPISDHFPISSVIRLQPDEHQ